jgi:hypothetical protein
LRCYVVTSKREQASDEERVVTVKWVRANIKTGARLALFAFAIQFALSFGHFHGLAAQVAPSIQSAQQQLPAPAPDSGQHPDDLCAICVVTALAGTAMAAAPPALLLPQAVELPHQTAETAFLHLHAPRAAFRSRAPPLL